MEEKIDNYLEMYPIYKTLINDINKNIEKNIKYISLGNGESALGRFVYNTDCSSVEIDYSLQKGKYSELLIEKIKEIYSIYYDVKITIQEVNDTIFDKISKPIVVKVKIPCDFNKKCYLQLDIETKQKLRIEAANNIKNGLVVLEENKEEKGFKI